MNTETGRIYTSDEDIAEAKARGEDIAMVSAEVAALVERGRIEMDKDHRRAEWRARWFGPAASSPQPAQS